MINVEIGPYVLCQRTSYSKMQVINKFGPPLDSEISKKILDDYIKQTTIPTRYFKIVGNRLDDFAEFDDIDYLFIPDGIELINDNALSCSSFKYIHLPNTVTDIGTDAFKQCDNLKEIILPNSVTSLGDGIFSRCTSLEKVILSENLTQIPDFAFAWCAELKDIILPDNIKQINNCAFYLCKNLKKINIPSTLNYFGNNPFMHSGVKNLKFDKDFIGNNSMCFYGNFVSGSSILGVEISKNVEHISPKLFEKVKGMYEINYFGDRKDFSKFKKNNRAFLRSFGNAKVNLIGNLEDMIEDNSKVENNKNKTEQIEL